MPEPLPTICGKCGKPLAGSPSLYYCSAACQQLWAAGQVDHEAPTASLGYQPSYPAAYYMGLAMQHQARGTATPPREDAA